MALHAVTGVFGYSGGYITRKLLAQGQTVRGLTNSPNRHSDVQGQIDVHGLTWTDPAKLTAALRNVEVLYNTYWVRFNHRNFTHAQAVVNTKTLFAAAKDAGVRRIVHISITNPDENSPLEYFRGKGQLEHALQNLDLSYAILRPAVLFGGHDILINNIAWMLRHIPFFGVFGDGQYKLQPIHVDDLADLAVRQGQSNDNAIINAIGPETFTYRELVETIAHIINVKRPIIRIPPEFGYWLGKALGWWMRDVTITREEIKGLMQDRLFAESPPAGQTKLTDWAKAHREQLGQKYASELRRRRDRVSEYGD